MMALMCGRDIRHFAEQRVSQNLFVALAVTSNCEEHHWQVRVIRRLRAVFPTEHGWEQKSRFVEAFAEKTFPHPEHVLSSL